MGKILIVEDEPLLRKRMASTLTSIGYHVTEAENGEVAIECLQGSDLPDLILLDMVMPKVNGWAFLDFQSSNLVFSKIPVVVISAYEEIAKSTPTRAYLPKPVEAQLLIKTVQEFI